jgi:hypothetical protein
MQKAIRLIELSLNFMAQGRRIIHCKEKKSEKELKRTILDKKK